MHSLASILRSRYPLAILAGLWLAAAFPKLGVAGLAWVAPGLMAAAAFGKGGWERFRIGYVAGLAFYLLSLYWLLLIPYRWHGIPFGPAAGWLALSAYLALFPATWVWAVAGAGTSRDAAGPAAPVATSAGVSAFPGPMLASLSLARMSWTGRALWALAGAALWVALEMLLTRLLSGFPWNLLGASQYQLLPLIQLASVTGVYGVSFLVAWLSLALVSAAVVILRRASLRSIWAGEIFLPVMVVAVLFNLGFRELRQVPPPARTLDVTFIQPSIPQTLIWDTNRDDQRFDDLLRLSAAALTNHTDVLLWPEAALPKLLRWHKGTFDAVTGLAATNRVWMIIGADDADPHEPPRRANDADFFNASFLISPAGVLEDRYKKRNLVIFGEYIPLERWLPFLKYFTPIEGGFTPGDRAVQFDLPDLGVKASVLICFEDIFPALARDAAQPDTHFLVNLTNDGWFEDSAAQWQQAVCAIFRAVENGLPLLRCSNNGLTCWVDAHGQLREIFRDAAGTIYGPGFLRAQIPLPPKDTLRPPTFYHAHGDWFGWSCVAVSALWRCAGLLRARAKSARPTAPTL